MDMDMDKKNETAETGNTAETANGKKKDRNMSRYFGNNLATVLYIVSIAMIVVGLLGVFFRYFILYAGILAVLGIVLFFITVRLKITDSDYDGVVNASVDSYRGKHLSDVIINRKKADPESFDLFTGYLYDRPGTLRKQGKDGKMRSSRYYITALKANRAGFIVSSSEYDTLTGDESHRLVHAEPGVSFTLEHPADKLLGDRRYVLRFADDGAEPDFVFHLPDDALADEKVKAIEELREPKTE